MTRLIDDLDLYAKLLCSVNVPGRNRPLSPAEAAGLIRRMMTEGMSVQEVSERVSVAEDTIKRFLRLSKLPPEYRNAVVWGTSTDCGVSFSAAAKIAQLSEQGDMKMLLGASMEHKFTKNEIENIVGLRRAGRGPDMAGCIEKVKSIRVRANPKHVYVITVSRETMSKLEASASPDEAAALLRGAVSERLGPDNVLAVVIRGLRVALSLNGEGAARFAALLERNRLTLGDSVAYFADRRRGQDPA